jgi:hypothetical protein
LPTILFCQFSIAQNSFLRSSSSVKNQGVHYLTVTVTCIKFVQFMTPCHPPPEHLVKIVLYFNALQRPFLRRYCSITFNLYSHASHGQKPTKIFVSHCITEQILALAELAERCRRIKLPKRARLRKVPVVTPKKPKMALQIELILQYPMLSLLNTSENQATCKPD